MTKVELLFKGIEDIREDIKINSKNNREDILRLESKIDDMQGSVVLKEDCEKSHTECTNLVELKVKKTEWSYRKILAVGGIIGTVSTLILGVFKVIYG